MILHRALALPTLLCLLLSLLAVPQGPMLVCRFTGQPMQVVPADSPKAHGSCCDVAREPGADGTVHYSLSAPGCCDLTQGNTQSAPPAIGAAGLELPAAALLVAPPSLPSAHLIETVPLLTVPREVAPRAPPRSSASPRAPPFVS